ncbi:hypothetical protein MRX96_048796, partial [Rhipicephalus microplus]
MPSVAMIRMGLLKTQTASFLPGFHILTGRILVRTFRNFCYGCVLKTLQTARYAGRRDDLHSVRSEGRIGGPLSVIPNTVGRSNDASSFSSIR